jgi:hypothetical protein
MCTSTILPHDLRHRLPHEPGSFVVPFIINLLQQFRKSTHRALVQHGTPGSIPVPDIEYAGVGRPASGYILGLGDVEGFRGDGAVQTT